MAEDVRRRKLTDQETQVLLDLRRIWGSQNTTDNVFFSDEDEAVLFVKAYDGSMPLCVVLTNIGQERADGSLSIWEYRRALMGPLAWARSDILIKALYFAARLRSLIHR